MATVDKETLKALKKAAGTQRSEVMEILMAAEFEEDSIVARHSDPSNRQIVIPEGMDLKNAVQYLKRADEDQEQGTSATYEINAHYDDMLVALDRAIRQLFGFGLQKAEYSFFGMSPPEMRTVTVGINDSGYPITTSVPAGKIALPALYDKDTGVGYIKTRERMKDDGRTVGTISAYVKKKHHQVLRTLIDLTRKFVRQDSIYRGQILDSKYNFLDLRGFDPNLLVLSQDVQKMVDAFILFPIREPERSDELGIEPNRAGLFYGDFGTGKTMTMRAIALWANEAGWTSIIAQPGDDLVELVQFARMYQPSVILLEDLDEQASGAAGRSQELNAILNTMNGVLGVNDRVMSIFTTNHPDRIHPAMLRPGRIHFAIELGALDGPGVQKMAENTGLALDGAINWEELADAHPLPPAYIKEALNRAGLLAETTGNGTVTHDDLRVALSEMRDHKKLQDGGEQGQDVPTLDLAFNKSIDHHVRRGLEDLVAANGGGRKRAGDLDGLAKDLVEIVKEGMRTY